MLSTRTPLRISFFGGGTDFKDYYSHGYGCVLSAAIDKYVYIMVNRKFDNNVQLNYRLTEIVDSADQVLHPTIREGMRFTGVERGIELSVLADFPSHGTGLGSSSSFIVGVLNALYTFKREKADAERLARGACRIEIDILGEPIGKQDQYVAAYGGFNLIRFNRDESVTIEPVRASAGTLSELKKRLVFFYTGIGRSSGSVLKEQKEQIGSKMDRLDRLRALAEEAKTRLEKGDLESFGEMLDESWQLKRTLASGVSSGTIDNYYKAAIAAGAKGGKILGAGGGGFFMLYCEPHKQAAVRKALSPMRQVEFDFPAKGSQIIFNDG